MHRSLGECTDTPIDGDDEATANEAERENTVMMRPLQSDGAQSKTFDYDLALHANSIP